MNGGTLYEVQDEFSSGYRQGHASNQHSQRQQPQSSAQGKLYNSLTEGYNIKPMNLLAPPTLFNSQGNPNPSQLPVQPAIHDVGPE